MVGLRVELGRGDPSHQLAKQVRGIFEAPVTSDI